MEKENINDKIVELNNIANGALVEKFNDALVEVFENCMDINTIQKRFRKIKLEVSFMPNEERTNVDTKVKCETMLSPTNIVDTIIFIGKRMGKSIGIEHNPEQQQLFTENDNVKPIGGNK